jgi:hypothetical protein
MSQMTEDERRVLTQARALRRLSEYPEWKVFFNLINTNAENWGSQAVGRSMSVDEMVAKEFPKGVLYGVKLAVTLPSAMWEQRADILAKYALESDESDEEVEAETSTRVGKAP